MTRDTLGAVAVLADLNGRWKSGSGVGEAWRHAADPDFDDDAWDEVGAPSRQECQQEHGRAHRQEHGVLLRKRFCVDAQWAGRSAEAGFSSQPQDGPTGSRRAWLEFAGLCDAADVWLDGHYLGHAEGLWGDHVFEMTDLLRADTGHVLMVEAYSTAPGSPHDSPRPPGAGPVEIGTGRGIAADDDGRSRGSGDRIDTDSDGARGISSRSSRARAEIVTTGPVRIASLGVAVREAVADEAAIRLRAVFDTDGTRHVAVTTTVTHLDGHERSTTTRQQPSGDTADDTHAAHATHRDWPAQDPPAQDLSAQDPSAQDLSAQDLSAQTPPDDAAGGVGDRRSGTGRHGGTAPELRAGRRRDGAAAIETQELLLARGRNEVQWQVGIDSPRLWWPQPFGAQHLYCVEVSVECCGEASHAAQRVTGLRSVTLRRGRLYVNGTVVSRGFVAGPGPTTDWADAAGMLALSAQRTSPSAFEQADRAGRLAVVHVPLGRTVLAGGERSLRSVAGRAAHDATALRGHHPSIVTWYAEPASDPVHSARRRLRWTARRRLRAAFRDADPTRPTATSQTMRGIGRPLR